WLEYNFQFGLNTKRSIQAKLISVIKLSKKVYSGVIRWSYRHTELFVDVMMAMEQTKHGSEEIF
ncbi:MAG: hypothetical protein IKH80_11000, partial [Bacteroidaceae bacterium]|nr:hypothetical protein [Bacteroidaceae bacterium]